MLWLTIILSYSKINNRAPSRSVCGVVGIDVAVFHYHKSFLVTKQMWLNCSKATFPIIDDVVVVLVIPIQTLQSSFTIAMFSLKVWTIIVNEQSQAKDCGKSSCSLEVNSR